VSRRSKRVLRERGKTVRAASFPRSKYAEGRL
jgi:hypothetical protein